MVGWSASSLIFLGAAGVVPSVAAAVELDEEVLESAGSGLIVRGFESSHAGNARFLGRGGLSSRTMISGCECLVFDGGEASSFLGLIDIGCVDFVSGVSFDG